MLRLARLDTLVAEIVSRIVAEALAESDLVYWSHGQDRTFDRIYATTSVLYSLCQLGVGHDLPLIRNAINYLKEVTEPSIQGRAGVIFLMLIGELPVSSMERFLEDIAEAQLTSADHRRESGSFLLPQGPVASEKGLTNWSNIHRDGASFHACHIADALLHMPSRFASSRSQAEPILSGIREFLTRSFIENEGWLLDLRGEVTPLTLYSYALCPALRIPLPANWRGVSTECNQLAAASTENVLKRFFGIMNATYAARSLEDSEFSLKASEFVSSQLATLPTQDQINSLGVVDLAGFLRSIAYGVDYLDRLFMASMSVRATNTIYGWNREG